MAIRVVCTCGSKLKVPDAAAGRTLKCPACGGPFTVDGRPEVAGPAPAAPLELTPLPMWEVIESDPAPEPMTTRDGPSAFQDLVAMMADEIEPSRPAVPQLNLPPRMARETHRGSHLTVTARTGKALNPFGLASFLFGLVGLLICWVPYLNLVVLPILGIGVALGAVGVLTAQLGKQSGLEWPLSGVGLCGIGLVGVLAVTGIAEAGRQRVVASLAAKAEEVRPPAVEVRRALVADLAKSRRRAEADAATERERFRTEQARMQAEALAERERNRQEQARIRAESDLARAEAFKREQAEEARLLAVQEEIDRRRAEKVAEQEAELERIKIGRRKAVHLLVDAGRLVVDGETERALAIYVQVVELYPELVESDNARSKARELSPELCQSPKYMLRFDKIDPERRQRDLERQLAERKAEVVAKAKRRQAGREQAAAMAPAAAAVGGQVAASNGKVLQENARQTEAMMRAMSGGR